MLGNSPQTPDDSNSQDTSKYVSNKGLTSSKPVGNLSPDKVAKATADVSNSTANVQKNNKQNNKLIKDSDLTLVINSWSKIPERMRSAIVAIS